MWIKSVQGRKTVLELSDSEKQAYHEVVETQRVADRANNYHLSYNENKKLVSLVEGFLKSIGLVYRSVDSPIRPQSQKRVRCEPFRMDGQSSYHPLDYTPVVVFDVTRPNLEIEASYVTAPRLRTTMDIMDDILRIVYPNKGDGIKTPYIDHVKEVAIDTNDPIVGSSDPRIYVASVKHLESILKRLQAVFVCLGDERLGALLHLHNDAEEQSRRNRFCADILSHQYKAVLETLVH